MKCRRSKNSRGARLRAPSSAPARTSAHSSTAHSAPAPETSTAASANATATVADPRTGVMRIDGHSEGAIRHTGIVIVGRDGAVKGDIAATIINVEGRVEGDLSAAQVLRLTATARVVGNLEAPRVAVARGASVRGRISTQRGLSAQATAELDENAVAELLADA